MMNLLRVIINSVLPASLITGLKKQILLGFSFLAVRICKTAQISRRSIKSSYWSVFLFPSQGSSEDKRVCCVENLAGIVLGRGSFIFEIREFYF